MILTKFYDVEVLPNFFSITIIDIHSYLKVMENACVIEVKKGQEIRTPIPLIQKYTVKEIKQLLEKVKSEQYYITDTDDSQLFPMINSISNMKAKYEIINGEKIPVITDLYGYNSANYDNLMIAALLMNVNQVDNTKDLITLLYNTSKRIIELQNSENMYGKNDYYMTSLSKYNLPFRGIDIMKLFALNKASVMVDKNGERKAIPKSLKQTSINLQWYELLEFQLPPIDEEEAIHYTKIDKYRGMSCEQLNTLIDEWDRYILDKYIPSMMHYNKNDCFIGCEMIRLYIDEIRLRYNIFNSYKVNVLSSSRSNMADLLFEKFYSEFSGLHPSQWKGKKTERKALSFKRVIFDFIKFKTPALQDMLEEMKKVIIYSIGKDAFVKNITINKLTYTVATGGLHSQDRPRALYSKWNEDSSSTGDDQYMYIHFDITSFYPSIMIKYGIAPAHLDQSVFVKLVSWLKETRVQAKHSEEPYIDGIPKNILAEALKIVINSIYGKLGFENGDLCDRLAVLKVTINGQLMILMLCEELELNGIEIVSANTDGIVVKLYKNKQETFNTICDNWKTLTQLEADSEEYKAYINRDINNYIAEELNGKVTYKGALHPLMYALNLTKGYDMPIVAEAVSNYFLKHIPIMDTLYAATNILDFCKTQNIGKQFHVEETTVENGKVVTKVSQRNCRFYVSNNGNLIEKVHNTLNSRAQMCAGYKATIINTLDDKDISLRDINYNYYFNEAVKIINPIKLGISPSQAGNPNKGTKSGKALIKKYSGAFNTLFDEQNE